MESKQFITGKCLIAADVDKTYVKQGQTNEKEAFMLDLAPNLNKAAILGTNLAVITGNSMHQLSTRFLPWYINQLLITNSLNTLANLHLFCNSGGIYIHFDTTHEAIKKILNRSGINKEDVLRVLTTHEDSKFSIKPEFVISEYVYKTKIPEDNAQQIIQILEDVWSQYKKEIENNIEELCKKYYIDSDPPADSKCSKYSFIENGKIKDALTGVDARRIRYIQNGKEEDFTAQITLKPILSWRYAKDYEETFGNDLRRSVIRSIQEKLDNSGLSHYCARPGGRSSIDITLEKVDKAYALEFLIDYLNIGGQKRLGEKYGHNTIYLGDEVISGGGNDYSITRIPGVLVLAVNPEPEFIPFLSNVLAPSAILTGPDAAAKILTEYNSIAQTAIMKHKEKQAATTKNAITLLKDKWFIERIREKVSSRHFKNISIEEKRMIHTLVTLVVRGDQKAKDWLNFITNEFDEILKTLENTNLVHIAGPGTSHEDN